MKNAHRKCLPVVLLMLIAPALFAGFAKKEASTPAEAIGVQQVSASAAAASPFPTAPLTPAQAIAMTTVTAAPESAVTPRAPEPDLQPLLRTGRKAVLPFYHCAYYGPCRDTFPLRNEVLKDYGYNCRERGLKNIDPRDPLSERTGMEVVDLITQAENKDHCQRLGTFLFRDAQEKYAGPATVAASTQAWSDIARPVGPLLSAPAYGAVSASTVPHLWFVWWKPGTRYAGGAKNWLPVTHVSLLYVADERLAAEMAALRPFTPTELQGAVAAGLPLPVLADAYRDQVNEFLGFTQSLDRADAHYAGWNIGGKTPAPAVLATWLDEWRFRVQEVAAARTPDEKKIRQAWLQSLVSAGNRNGLRMPAPTEFAKSPQATLEDAATLVALLRSNDLQALPAEALKKIPADAPPGYDALRTQLLKRTALAGLDGEPARLAAIGAWATLIAESRVRAAGNDSWALVSKTDLDRAIAALDAMVVTFIPAGKNCCARVAETNAYTRWRGWPDDKKFPTGSARVVHDTWEQNARDERRKVAVNGPDPTIAWRYQRQLAELYNRKADIDRVKQAAAAWGGAGSSAPAGVVDWNCNSVNRNCESRWQGGGATGGPSGVGRAATEAADLQLSGIDREIAELQARIAKETEESPVTFQQPVDVAIVNFTRTIRIEDPDAGEPVVARYRREEQGMRSRELLDKVFRQSEGDSRQAVQLASRRMLDARIESYLAGMAQTPGVTALDLMRERIWLRNLLRSLILPRDANLGATGFWFRYYFPNAS